MLHKHGFPCPWQLYVPVWRGNSGWPEGRIPLTLAAPQAAKPGRQSHYLARRTPACLTDNPTEELKDTQDTVWQTDSLAGWGSVSVKGLEHRQHHVESWPRLTLRLAQRSTSCSRVESWLTKHFSLSGLALMDFDDRTDTGNTLKPPVALWNILLTCHNWPYDMLYRKRKHTKI